MYRILSHISFSPFSALSLCGVEGLAETFLSHPVSGPFLPDLPSFLIRRTFHLNLGIPLGCFPVLCVTSSFLFTCLSHSNVLITITLGSTIALSKISRNDPRQFSVSKQLFLKTCFQNFIVFNLYDLLWRVVRRFRQSSVLVGSRREWTPWHHLLRDKQEGRRPVLRPASTNLWGPSLRHGCCLSPLVYYSSCRYVSIRVL